MDADQDILLKHNQEQSLRQFRLSCLQLVASQQAGRPIATEALITEAIKLCDFLTNGKPEKNEANQ